MSENDGEEMNTFRDFAQPFRAVIAGVHRGHVGEQSLCSADVAGGFFAADVLLAGLK